jgi:predicted DNA-binding transcriptional regulator YafY
MNTLLRFFEILSLIPKEPDKISTPDLFKKLIAANYDISYRTLQRDLEKISSSQIFPLTSTEGTNPIEWFWPKHLPSIQFPLMSVDEALVFKLVEDYLNPLLPLTMSEQLLHYFALADATLKASPMAEWANKVRIIPNSLALLPAEIDDDVLQVVYSALLKNQKISICHKNSNEPHNQDLISPLGLVFKGNEIYLVAYMDDMTSHMPLHQIESAELLEDKAINCSGFDFDDYIREGSFEHQKSNKAKLRLIIRVDDQLNEKLSITPLSFDQSILSSANGFIVEATVQDNLQIRQWLHSQSDSVEIIAPNTLRDEFKQKAERLHKIYL